MRQLVKQKKPASDEKEGKLGKKRNDSKKAGMVNGRTLKGKQKRAKWRGGDRIYEGGGKG